MATTVKRDEKSVFVPVVITIDSEEDLRKFLNGTHAVSHGYKSDRDGVEEYMAKLNSDVYSITFGNGSVK